MVALTGYTVHDDSTLIPQPNIVQAYPPPILCDLSPSSSDDDDDPFNIPLLLALPQPTSELPFLYTDSYLNPDTLAFHPRSTANCIEGGNDPSPSTDPPTEASSQFLEKWSSLFSTNSSGH